MAKRKDSICGLAFSSQAIILTQYYPAESLITNVSIQPLPGGDFWQTAEAGLSDMLREIGLSNEDTVVALPSEFSVIKKFILDADERDVAEALEWELGQHVIGATDDYTWDYQRCVQQEQNGLTQYLMVACHTAAVERISRLVKSNRLNPVVVDLDVFSLINVFEANYPELVSSPTVLIQGDTGRSKIVLARGGDFWDMQPLSHTPAQTPQEIAASMRAGFDRLISFNPGFVEDGTDLQVMLGGGWFSEAEAVQAVAEAFPGAQAINPFKAITCSAGMQEEDMARYAPQLAVAVGLAVRGRDNASQ